MTASNSFASRFFRALLVRWSGFVTLLLLVVAAAGFYLGAGVKLKLSLTDLLPDDHPSVVKFNQLTEVVGGVGFFAIVLTAEDKKSHRAVVARVLEGLKRSPLIRSADYHRERRFFVDRMLYYMDVKQLTDLESNIKKQITRSRRKVFDIGLWDEEETAAADKATAVFNDELTELAKQSARTTNLLVSEDGKHLLVMAKPNFDSTDLGKAKELVAYCETMLKDILPPQVSYRFGERYYNKIIETQLIEGDITRLGVISILLILVVLLLYTRSFRALAVIFIPVLMGLGITMGLTRLWIGHINIITGFLVGILSGLGVDYSVHLFLRLRLERREPSNDEPDVFWRTIASTGHSIFVGAAAASVTFFLLSFSSFRAFSEFGFVCGTGIAAVFICLLLSFTALAKFFRADQLPIPKPLFANFRFPMIPVPRGLAIAAVCTGLVMMMATRVGFQYDFEKMMKHSGEMEYTAKLIDNVYQRSAVPSAIAMPNREDALAVERIIKDKYMPKIVNEVVSGASIIPEKQAEKQVIMLRIKDQLKTIKDKWLEKSLGVPASAVRTWVNAQPFVYDEIPPHLQDSLRGQKNNGGYLLYVYPAVSMSDARTIAQYAGVFKDLEKEYPKMLSGSDAVIFSDILDLIKRDGSILLALIFLSVGFFIWLNTRRLDDTAASYVPLLISFVVGMGLMAIFGVEFNILNITIIPSFVALGIDVPIHLVHRAREIRSGFKAARDLAPSINLAMGTAALGFGILIFARAGVLKSLGEIAILGTLAIWWVGLWMLAAVLEWQWRRRFSAKSSENSSGINPVAEVSADHSLQMKH